MSSKLRVLYFPNWGQSGAFRRFLLFILLVLVLAVFLHTREERFEILERGTQSERYVIAQTSFSFADEDATQILRQQAVRDIGEIYRIDEKVLQECTRRLERFLVEDEHWRQQMSQATFEQMLKGAHHLDAALLKMRFTDYRTLQKMKQLKMSVRNVEPMPSKEALEQLNISEDFWRMIREKNLSPDLFSDAQEFLIQWFRLEPWSFHQDISTERLLRERVQETIPLKYSVIDAGSPIIEPGERVTERHLSMLNAMKEAFAKERKQWEPTTIVGSLLLALVFVVLSIGYLKIRIPELLASLSKLTLLVTIVIVTLTLSKLVEYFLFHQGNILLPYIHYPIFLPFASLILCILIGTEIALFVTALLSIVMTLSLASAFQFDLFLSINIVTGIAAILCSRRMRKRSQIFAVCARLFLISLPVVIAFDLAGKTFLSKGLFGDVLTSFVSLFITAVTVVCILPTLESFFGLLTDITLMQLLDPNHVLLRRLSLEAPGTYQHCLVAGNLAESSAHAINANGLFCRVSTLYHDIGKLFNPHYFTENQFGGFNIHQLLTPRESAQVIMAHVTEGETLAKKHHLPLSFIDIIREHHGTSLVYYFYCKQVELAGKDATQVDEKQFRYKGPKPKTRESAIIMIADSVEATTRSLDEISEEILIKLVDRIVKEKIDDGQFDDCKLSFEELSIIKKTMVKTLIIAHHMRIKYPSKLSV
ncbi:MAG: HDIG domain-containing protein [Simkania sp.]|nr:HDIG domain-containing protein [Simkania sp.]